MTIIIHSILQLFKCDDRVMVLDDNNIEETTEIFIYFFSTHSLLGRYFTDVLFEVSVQKLKLYLGLESCNL